ncbi:MAG: hypothetical protein ABIH67_02950 [Candidatus Uhrbacteria bacterium]
MNGNEYIAPELAAEEKRYKYSLWWVSNRSTLSKIGLIVLACADTVLILYGLWVVIDTYLISYETERAQIVTMNLNQSIRHQVNLQTTPEPVTLSSSVNVFGIGEQRYDFYATISNENDDYWLEFDYHFTYGGKQTDPQSGFIYPSESKPIVDLAWVSTSAPANAKVVIENLNWHYINHHDYPDFAVWRDDRMNFEVTQAGFENLELDNVGRSSFLVNNETAYSYWEPKFYVILYRGSQVAGITSTVANQLEAGEERLLEQNWYGSLSAVTKVEVIPELALLDPDVYMPLTSEDKGDLRERVLVR